MMRVGMLWLDAQPEEALPSRLERAVSYYRQKYGQEPNLCFVNPGMAEATLPPSIGSLRLRTNRAVLPNHFWLGVKEADPEAA